MRIGFISTRFHGTDGVSLEASKWGKVLENDLGHECFWFGGKLDTSKDKSLFCKEAFFGDESITSLQENIFDPATNLSDSIERQISDLQSYLEECLEQFINQFSLDIIIPQNVLAIPMHVPLGLAVTNISAKGMPTIAHHHDFYWERDRFLKGCAQQYLDKAFPPPYKEKFEHVVINSGAKKSLKNRLDIESTVIPNVFDFENPPANYDAYGEDFKEELGISSDEIMILQPTRIVPRKGIELSISLCSKLQSKLGKKICLVVSHLYGDEGSQYYEDLVELAEEKSVKVIWAGERVGDSRGYNEAGEKIYNLWDIYPLADFVTYPSLYEGFGNALLETFYFCKPVLVNRYPVYKDDIEPLGFKVVNIDGDISEDAVRDTIKLLSDKNLVDEWTSYNYSLCEKYFSHKVLRSSLEQIISRFF